MTPLIPRRSLKGNPPTTYLRVLKAIAKLERQGQAVRGRWTCDSLAAEVGISRARIYVILDQMERHGLVEKLPPYALVEKTEKKVAA